MAAIEKDPKRRFHSREEILVAYRKFIDRMKPQLPKLPMLHAMLAAAAAHEGGKKNS